MSASLRSKRIIQRLKPGIPKRYLLLVAALVWTFAGGMLFGKGAIYLSSHGDRLFLRFAVALAGGLGFFMLLFSKISLKHITRIHAIDIVRPCLFSFFDLKGYVMMGSMIAGGALLRKFELVDPLLRAKFYACMGTPLLLSAARIYYAWARYPRFVGANE
ncbi:MAG: hypothetical protein JNG85_08725 [Spirochaetaceae bacterium]|nr:hypothetical protein [Spirochaetaceae bacterium]